MCMMPVGTAPHLKPAVKGTHASIGWVSVGLLGRRPCCCFCLLAAGHLCAKHGCVPGRMVATRRVQPVMILQVCS
jgi:hypothetical protein